MVTASFGYVTLEQEHFLTFTILLKAVVVMMTYLPTCFRKWLPGAGCVVRGMASLAFTAKRWSRLCKRLFTCSSRRRFSALNWCRHDSRDATITQQRSFPELWYNHITKLYLFLLPCNYLFLPKDYHPVKLHVASGEVLRALMTPRTMMAGA
jgi:hypothetical protein